MRPVYNRPEMLQLSIEYEIKARQKAGIRDNEYLTLFLIEYGASRKVIQIAKSYPYPAVYRYRRREYESLDIYNALFNRKKYWRYGISRNLLEGMKDAFQLSDEYVLMIEDDILIHETYFQYINVLLGMPEIFPFSAISASRNGMFAWANNTVHQDQSGNATIVRKGHDYSPWGPLLGKWFFMKYVLPYANEEFYENRLQAMEKLNAKYTRFFGREYKYTDIKHGEQAGLINRLVDVAMIDDGAYVITPDLDRQIHIGFYGANRGKNKINGLTFKGRVQNLYDMIQQRKLYDFAKRKKYNDYRYFSEDLASWDGKMVLMD